MSVPPDRFLFADRFGFRRILPHVAIAFAALLVFTVTVSYDFVWDDKDVIYNARSAAEQGGTAELLRVPFSFDRTGEEENIRYYRPVSLLTIWFNDPFGQPSPVLYHLFNVLLHAANSVLVFVLFLVVLEERAGAFLGGLIFAVHPVHAESVAWISGRTDMLAAFFTLVTLLIWRRTRKYKGGLRVGFYILSLGTFMLACLSKETAFLLPFLAVPWVLTDWFRSSRRSAAVVYPDLVWVAGLCVVLGLVFWQRTVFLGVAQPIVVLPFAMGEALKNFAVYLRFLFLPVSLRVYYPPGQPVLTYLHLALSAGLLMLGLSFSGKRHCLVGIVALAWIFLFLGPVTGAVNLGLSVVAQRFCYLPSVGFALLAGYIMGLGYNRTAQRRIYSGLITVLVVLLGTGSAINASGWKNDITFFEKAIGDNPVSIANMYYNLGNAYIEAGALSRGIENLEEAVRRYPDYGEAILNLAAAHIRLREPERALELLERAEEVIPGNGSLWTNKGAVLEMLGRNREALEAYGKAVELNPPNPIAVFQSANLLFRLGKYEESLAAYGAVQTIDPDHYGALLGSGRSLEAMNRLEASAEAYLRAVEERPGESAGYLDLGRVLLDQGRSREAAAVYQTALNRDIADASLHRGLVIAYLQSGQIARARRKIDILSRENPSLGLELNDMVDELERRGKRK